MLEDGTYDAIVFDADDHPDGGVSVDLTIINGEHKGAALTVVSPDFEGHVFDLLGIPATLTVRGGAPSVVFEP